MTKHQLIEEAMRLPPEDRRDVVEVLTCTLDWDEVEEPSAEVLAELHRRRQEFDRDPSIGIPAEEVFRRLREKRR